MHKCWARDKGEAAMEQAIHDGEIEAAVALGFTASMAALGLFFIPMAVGVSMYITGAPNAAMIVFIAFYLTCVLGTWWWYQRKGAEVRCE